MQFIASAAALRALHTQSSMVASELATCGDVNMGSSFYKKARVKQVSPTPRKHPEKHQRNGLRITLILLACLISGTEIYLLVNKLSTDKIPQMAEVSQTTTATPAIIR